MVVIIISVVIIINVVTINNGNNITIYVNDKYFFW